MSEPISAWKCVREEQGWAEEKDTNLTHRFFTIWKRTNQMINGNRSEWVFTMVRFYFLETVPHYRLFHFRPIVMCRTVSVSMRIARGGDSHDCRLNPAPTIW